MYADVVRRAIASFSVTINNNLLSVANEAAAYRWEKSAAWLITCTLHLQAPKASNLRHKAKQPGHDAQTPVKNGSNFSHYRQVEQVV